MFFDKLAKLINKANLTQKEFCEKLNDQSKPYYYGIRQDTLSKMKNTRTAVPIEFVCAVSRFFNISIDELVGNEHQDKAECGLTFADLAHVFAILYKYFDFKITRDEYGEGEIYNLEHRKNSLFPNHATRMMDSFLDNMFLACEADQLTKGLSGINVFDMWYDKFAQGACNYTLFGHRIEKNDNHIVEFDNILSIPEEGLPFNEETDIGSSQPDNK